MSMPEEGIIRPSKGSLTYNSYLKIPELLQLQQEISEPKEHDETLFIIIHQVYELWFKQILHEVDRCALWLDQDQVIESLRSLRRIASIQDVLIKQVDILETMAPDEFNRFRNRLNPASGFQSFQFRLLEFKLGLKDSAYLKYFDADPDFQGQLRDALESPTFYDVFWRFLARKGAPIPKELLDRNVTQAHEPSEELTQTLAEIYRQHASRHEEYTLMEAMMDLDEKLILWRYRHIAMVQRMIGDLHGTGGSPGASYLAKTLNKRAFPEIWSLRNYLGRS